MKKLYVILICFITHCVLSSSVEIEWTKSNDKNTEGYILTYGSDVLSTTMKVGYTHSYIVMGLSEGKEYWFTVQPYSKNGTYGPCSDTIKFKIPKKEEIQLKTKPIVKIKKVYK